MGKEEEASIEDRVLPVVQQLLGAGDRLAQRSFDRRAGFLRLEEAVLRRELESLEGQDGAEARTRALSRRLDGVVQQRDEARSSLRKVELGRQVEAGEVMVLGRVTDRQRSPAGGLEVVLTHKTSKDPSGVAQTTTDDLGFYQFRVPEKAFRKFFRGAQQLVLTARDASGKRQEIGTRQLGELATRRRLFHVVLPESFERPGETQKDPPPTLADIEGIGPKRIQRLARQGVSEVGEVAALEPARLAKILRVPVERAAAMIAQASSLLAGSRS